MPPASPAATRVWRMASRIEVLPWSTCPRTVTMGGRGLSLPGSSFAREKSSSREVVTTSPCPSADSTATTSSLATGSTVYPNSSATISAVAKSMTWLIVARILEAMSFLMTSTGLTPSFSARSLTDSVGGRTARRSPLVSILVATAGLNAVRAASIAPGARGAAAFRVSLRCWRKLTSSFWLMPSSRASSCAFMPELLIMPPGPNSKPGGASALGGPWVCPPAVRATSPQGGEETFQIAARRLPTWWGGRPYLLDFKPEFWLDRGFQGAIHRPSFAGQFDALRGRVEVGAAAWGPPCSVHAYAAVGLADEADQVRLAGLLPAGDAGPNRLVAPGARPLRRLRRHLPMNGEEKATSQ